LRRGVVPAVREKILIPGAKTSLTFHLAALREGPEGHRNFSGRAGGSESKAPEAFGSASPEGSTRGASLCGMLHRWNSGLREETGPTRVDESGFVNAARGASSCLLLQFAVRFAKRTAQGAARRPAPSHRERDQLFDNSGRSGRENECTRAPGEAHIPYVRTIGSRLPGRSFRDACRENLSEASSRIRVRGRCRYGRQG
jgi:hypothetical protein